MIRIITPDFREGADGQIVKGPLIRPKDAATLIIVDRTTSVPRILMGRRKMTLRFMPGLYVFPGGRLDADDARMAHLGGYAPDTLARLLHRTPRATERRMRALAMTAIRETYEEAGVLLGANTAPARVPNPEWQAFADHGVTPDIGALAFIARAITPPARPRRFDTRFFVADHSAIAVELPLDQRPDTDLEAVEWLTWDEVMAKPLPFITRQILLGLEPRIGHTDWGIGRIPVNFFYNRRNVYYCEDV